MNKWLYARAEDARYTLHRVRLHIARLSLLRSPHRGMHPARAHIHAPGSVGDWAADAITGFVGSWAFVGIHAVWFVSWIFVFHFEPFPFGLLTLLVSLEAIYLSTFVMMSQNRSAARDRVRDDTEAEEVNHLAGINDTQLVILQELRALNSRVSGQSASQAVDGSQPSPQASQMPPSAPSGPAAPLAARRAVMQQPRVRRQPERHRSAS